MTVSLASVKFTDLLPLIESSTVKSIVFQPTGSSMFPTIVPGDRILVSLRSVVCIGEIGLCKTVSGSILLHRIIQVEPELKTKGDSLDHEDPEKIERCYGVVERIERTWISTLRRWKLRLKSSLMRCLDRDSRKVKDESRSSFQL